MIEKSDKEKVDTMIKLEVVPQSIKPVTVVDKAKNIGATVMSSAEAQQTKAALKNTLTSLKHGDVKGLVKGAQDLLAAKAAIEKKLITGAAGALGIVRVSL